MEISNDFPQFTKCTSEVVPPSVLRDAHRVGRMAGVSLDAQFYKHNEAFVINLQLTLELPTRYKFGNGLVRTVEPVFVEFSSDYPDRVPKAYIGRKDFDFANTPHIYCERDGLRPICLFRGNGDEWFANMEIEDFIKYLRSWYEGLASEDNIGDGGEFEPLRLEGYCSTIYYDYEKLCRDIEINSCQSNYKLYLFVYLTNKFIILITEENKWILKSDRIKSEDYMTGALCWSSSSEPIDEYDVNLPTTYGGLRTYAGKYDIDIEKASLDILEFCKWQATRFALILAIRRRKNLIGVNSPFQLVNFEVSVNKQDDKSVLTDDSVVCFHAQKSPFTIAKAHEMSQLDQNVSLSLVVAGCGALGSKISMHLLRSGITNILFVDPDTLDEHNMSRHALLSNSVNCNKAEEMMKVALQIFRHDTLKVAAVNFSVELLLNRAIFEARQVKYILDFTASRVAFNQLVRNCKDRPRAISAAIYDNGNFALLLAEGEGLRIDDLQNSYFASYKNDKAVSDYLIRERKNIDGEGTVISVGLGCNSETFILSDDVISLYASSMSMTLKSIFEQSQNGGCWIFKAGKDGSLTVTKMEVPPFQVYRSGEWEVRVCDKAMSDIINQTRDGGSLENGGYLIGQCNMKNHTIHVIDTVEAPEDTVHHEDSLILGKKGWKKELSKISRRSGATFGYVGEWHSHPNGPDDFSEVDIAEFKHKLEEMDETSSMWPIVELLITPNVVNCLVLERGD